MNAEIGAGTGQRQNEDGRLWICVRDDRPAGSEAASAGRFNIFCVNCFLVVWLEVSGFRFPG